MNICWKKVICSLAILMLGILFMGNSANALEWDDPAGELQDNDTGLCYVLKDDASCYVSRCRSSYATENIVVPKTIQWEGITYTVTSIGEAAFKELTKVKEIVLPSSITAIGEFAFRDMSNLTTLKIPMNVREIGSDFVMGCVNLKNLSVDMNNPYFSSDSAGCIYNNDKSKLLFGSPSAHTIKIPEGVTELDVNAIQYNQMVEEVIIPFTVDTIPKRFFAYCSNLKKVTLNTGVKRIEQEAFVECTSLKIISFPNGLTQIGNPEDVFANGVFIHCDSLEEVVLPDTMEYICRNAFLFCENLKKVTIYAKNVTIESYAFSDCCNEMTIYGYYGSTVQEYAKSDSHLFKSLNKPTAKGSVLVVSTDDCRVKITSSDENNLTVAYLKSTNRNAKTITIPDKVTVDGITYKVTSVGANALANNKKITRVTIGKNVTLIGKNAFKNCKKLKTITIKSIKIKSVGKNAIKGINKKAILKVPKKQLAKYKKLFKSKTGYKNTMKIKK